MSLNDCSLGAYCSTDFLSEWAEKKDVEINKKMRHEAILDRELYIYPAFDNSDF